MGPVAGLTARYVSFQAVDTAARRPVPESGSDPLGTSESGTALVENAARRALVDDLRSRMRAAGWAETGRGAQWWSYRFSR